MLAASLTDTQGIVALAALALAAFSAIACAALVRGVRRLHSDQKVVLGDGARRDLVAHGVSLQQAFVALEEFVNDASARLDGRLDGIESALEGAISRQALVRYDAYNELSGQQSVSIALLDGRGTGVVLTCIHHRDQARVYAKRVLEGREELELSPEETEAVQVALAREPLAGRSPSQPTRTAASGAVDAIGP
jgi:Protein of unknown function (DUF4446)